MRTFVLILIFGALVAIYLVMRDSAPSTVQEKSIEEMTDTVQKIEIHPPLSQPANKDVPLKEIEKKETQDEVQNQDPAFADKHQERPSETSVPETTERPVKRITMREDEIARRAKYSEKIVHENMNKAAYFVKQGRQSMKELKDVLKELDNDEQN